MSTRGCAPAVTQVETAMFGVGVRGVRDADQLGLGRPERSMVEQWPAPSGEDGNDVELQFVERISLEQRLASVGTHLQYVRVAGRDSCLACATAPVGDEGDAARR